MFSISPFLLNFCSSVTTILFEISPIVDMIFNNVFTSDFVFLSGIFQSNFDSVNAIKTFSKLSLANISNIVLT